RVLLPRQPHRQHPDRLPPAVRVAWRPGRVPLNHAAAQFPRGWGMGNAPQSGGGKIKALEDSRRKPRPSRRRSQKVRGPLPWTPLLFVHKIPTPVRSWNAPLSGCGLE
ncbi:MAG TPA: hypothetical protein VE844_11700, partial [Gammaproteobacteria bacterium]|nr:hypothetical protein [Gammaproteobacteria bacterium]